MAKDYRKTTSSRSSRHYSAKAPAPAVGSIKWAVIGVFLGLIVALIIFWEYAPELAVGVNKLKPENIKPITHSIAAKKTPAVQQTTETAQSHAPQFDFYTMLPQMQVAPNSQAPTKPPPPNMPQAATPATSLATNDAANTTPPANAPTTATQASTTPASQPVAATQTPPLVPSMVAKAEASALGETTTPVNTANNKPELTTTTPPPPAQESTPGTTEQEGSYLIQIASVKDYTVADRLKAELTMMGYNVTIQKSLVNGQQWNRVNIGPYSSKKTALAKQQSLREKNISSILIKEHS